MELIDDSIFVRTVAVCNEMSDTNKVHRMCRAYSSLIFDCR